MSSRVLSSRGESGYNRRRPPIGSLSLHRKGFAMSVVATEMVLVVPTALFHELGYFQGFSADVSRYLPRLLEGREVEYLPRGRMEEDPSYKQLIPYVLFRW